MNVSQTASSLSIAALVVSCHKLVTSIEPSQHFVAAFNCNITRTIELSDGERILMTRFAILPQYQIMTVKQKQTPRKHIPR